VEGIKIKQSLSPCPFCHNPNAYCRKAVGFDGSYKEISCPGCGARSGIHHNIQIIVDGWNKRTEKAFVVRTIADLQGRST
jgi:hypothetical protein